MKFEILKRNYLKRNIMIGILIVGIIGAIVLNFTRAKYKTTESIPLVNGTINYELSDFNLIGIYVEEGGDYTKIDQIPDSGYTLNEEKSYCKIGDEKQNMTINYDMNTKTLNIAPMTSKGTKCYLYFDKEPTLKDTILANNIVNSGTPNFSKTAQASCSSTRLCEETNGIYKAEDDDGTTYYYRGEVNNNWVLFAGYYWRIIRINGDGSIRLIYSGNKESGPMTTGTNTMINSSQAFNLDYDRSEYAGYMYTMNQQHGNTTNSSIKTVIDNWYNSNLATHADKISKEAGFCGDREMASGSSWSSRPNGSTIYYAAYERLETNKMPTLKCSNSNDLYTVSGSSKGNKKLRNPIGLITADEVAMAGGVVDNEKYYLYNGESYWTMSPYRSDAGHARVFRVYLFGNLDGNVRVNSSSQGIRPVINLDASVTVTSGNGTSSTPYEI